ncbi:MAG: WYL domain-containing protein [Spirochaetales bacterium]|nr:WYL domain-containing protein [Candidatus Physcosoma equi]
MSRLERIMDMINVLCLEDGRLNYRYIKDKYGMSNREFRRDIDFIRERLTDVGYMDKLSTVEYVRTPKGNYYVFNGDKPKLNESFVNSTIAEALAVAADNPLREQFDGTWSPEKPTPEGLVTPVRYMYQAIEKVNYSIFSTLVAAIKEKYKVELGYVNAKGHESKLEIYPLQLINYSQIWYLMAKTQYASIRTFSLSRIASASIKDYEKFEFDDYSILEKATSGYGIFTSVKVEPIWYTMRFYGVAANIVANQTWHKEEKGRWVDGAYELSVPATSDVEVMGRMLSYAPNAEPLSPEAFVQRYREIIGQCKERIEGEKT